MQEPWDGPASIAFTDGTRIGAVLDCTACGRRATGSRRMIVVLASEVGVLDVPEEKIVKKGRLEPGRMFYIDTAEHRIIDDDELKETICKAHPYRDWLNTHRVVLPGRLEAKTSSGTRAEAPLLERQQVFGYSQEDIDVLLKPWRSRRTSPGPWATTRPLAVLSSRPQLLFNYFKQLFAQVTNPPIDPIREEIVMSLEMDIGRERNLLGTTPEHCRRLHLSSPIITNEQLAYIKQLDQADLRAATISTLSRPRAARPRWKRPSTASARTPASAIRGGATLLVLSDRGVNAGVRSHPQPAGDGRRAPASGARNEPVRVRPDR